MKYVFRADYAFMACMALGMVPMLAISSLAQSPRQPRAVAPVPTEFAVINQDDQVKPVAHYATVTDQAVARRTRVSPAAAEIPAPTVVPEPTSVLSSPPRPITTSTEGVTMHLSDGGTPQTSWTTSGVSNGGFSTTGLAGGGCATGAFATGDCADGGCTDGSCLGTLPPCSGTCGGTCVTCCAAPVWQHRSGVYGEYLYLRPREAEIVYAAPIDGPIVNAPNNPIQVGPLGMLDPEYQSGYRAGFAVALSNCSSIAVGYTRFDSSTSGSITTNPPEVLRSLVAHPSSTSAATDWLDASAQYDVDFQFADISYLGLLRGGDRYAINYLVGARYGKLDQAFSSTFTANGSEQVTSDISFEGGGIRLGLEGERYSCSKKLFLYSRGNASFLAGQFDADYFQGQSFDPEVADTSWSAGRIVTVLDLEAGVGWRSQGGRLKLSTGYMVSGWLNAVKANNFIQSVRENNYLNLSDTFTFDGYVVRGEFRF